jgi:hypothetical protein
MKWCNVAPVKSEYDLDNSMEQWPHLPPRRRGACNQTARAKLETGYHRSGATALLLRNLSFLLEMSAEQNATQRSRVLNILQAI